jgi:hypothetical protein
LYSIKIMKKGAVVFMKWVLVLAVPVVVVSCQSTGVVEKRKPIAESPLFSVLLNPNKLSAESRQWLESEG